MLKATTIQTAELLDLLPEEDASLVNALVKKLIKAWDPEYTKLTAKEKEIIEKSEQEMQNGEYYSSDEVWK